MRWASTILSTLLWASCLTAADTKPPRPHDIIRFGCSVAPSTSTLYGSFRTEQYYAASAWASYATGPDFNLLLSQYPLTSKGRTKALHDCDKWMQSVEKAMKQAHKP